jgi:hypothetical protein
MAIAPTSLILVALLPTWRDLEIARLLGWYRIPFRTAPKVVSVDYLAFYQPGSFGEEGGRIQFAAAVRGHELTTRAELLHDEADHPRAGEEYYKILAEKWRRITFFYTTGEYLLNARTIHELIVQSGEREMLWQALRERASQSQAYGSDGFLDMEVDPAILAGLLGIRDLEK